MDAFARSAHELSDGFYDPDMLQAEPRAGTAGARVDDPHGLARQRGERNRLANNRPASRITCPVDLKQGGNFFIV